MALYKKVLMALDFNQDNDAIIEKGKTIAAENGAELYLIHVNESIAVGYAVDGFSFNDQIVALQSSIAKEAQEQMTKLAGELNIPNERQLLREGSPATEIHQAADDHDIDLIVLGTHGQKGLQLLLGSTANSVLHGVSCDVLTVRLKS